MMHRAWSSIVEVPYCFSRSYVKFQGHTALKIIEFDPNWVFPDCNSSLNSQMAMKCWTKLETAKERCPIVFQGHPSNFKVTRDKTSPILTQIGRFRTIGRSQLSNPSDLPCSRSYVKFQGHTALKIIEFDPNWAFPDSNSSLNSPMAMKCCTKLETAKERCPIVFQGHPSNFKVTRDKTSPILTQIGRFRIIGRSQLSNPSDLPFFFSFINLTHYGLVTPYGDIDLGQHWLKELIPSLRSWLWHHRLPNVTTTEAQPRLWWHLGICGVTAMTENEVSISILSWYHKINFKLVDVVKPNCFSAAQV